MFGVLIGIGALAVAFAVGAWWLRRAVARGRRRVDEVLAGRPVVMAESALSLGVASRGPRQLRGSGTLALCHDRLLFVQWVPSSVLEIPLGDITEVDTTMTHLGRSVGAALVRISWIGADGTDQIALQVRDVERWATALARRGS